LEWNNGVIVVGHSCAIDFSNFIANLKLSDVDEYNKTQRFHNIVKRINLDFRGINNDTSYAFYTGSHARGTDIYTSDVDVVIILPYDTFARFYSYSSNGQAALLQEVRKSLMRTYPSTTIGGDGQVIVVEFTDGMKFEIVPAFINEDQKTYTYPDSNDGGSWRVMDPKSEVAEFNRMNDICNSNLKALCKMMREWNIKNDVGLKGILIDSMAYHFIKAYQYNSKGPLYYDWMSRDFFMYLYENYDRTYWSAFGSNWHIFNPKGFRNIAKKSYDTCLNAIEFANTDNIWSYYLTWGEIYGTKFKQ